MGGGERKGYAFKGGPVSRSPSRAKRNEYVSGGFNDTRGETLEPKLQCVPVECMQHTPRMLGHESVYKY